MYTARALSFTFPVNGVLANEDQAAYAAEAECKLHFADKITHRPYVTHMRQVHRMNTPQVRVIPFARSAMD